MRKLALLLAAVVVCILPSVTVLASDVSTAKYMTTIRAFNSSWLSTATETFGVLTGLSTNGSITAGILNSTATDAIAHIGSTDVEFMPAANTSYPWCFVVPSLTPRGTNEIHLYSSNVTGGKYRYFPGSTGFGVNDHATIEFGNNFVFTIRGWIDVTAGASKAFAGKGSVLDFSVSPTITGNITAVFTGFPGNTVSVAGLSSGEATIILQADTVHMWLSVVDSTGWYVSSNQTAVPIVDNANPWVFCYGSATPYVEYVSIYKAGVLGGYWDWEYGTTFSDSSGNGNTATPTFRTASSNSDVTLTLVSQESLIAQGEPTATTGAGWNMLGATPSEPAYLFHEGGTGLNGVPEISTAATNNHLPPAAFLFPLAFGTIVLGGYATFKTTHNYRMGIRGSLLWMELTMIVITIFWYVGGVLPGFILIPFALVFVLTLLIRNPQSPVVN